MSDPGENLPSRGRVRGKLTEVFGADLRSLAVFRMVLGVLVLADLVNRSTDLVAHYTDEGIVPRAVIERPPDTELFPSAEWMSSGWSLSLNMLSGHPLFQALLFLVGGLAAVALLLGYRTRTATIVVWVILLSIHHRNPLILASGDVLLRMLLFWGMFLPLGAVWSLDRLREAVPARLSMRFLSFGTMALFLQVAFMHWFTAILKSGPEWRTDFTALYYALSLDQLARPLGTFLLEFPTLLTVLTIGTLVLEAVGPFLLFSPFFTGPVRTATILAFMSLHFGILLTMDIGIFPFISAFCMVCFLPTWFWETALPRLQAISPPRLLDATRRLPQAIPQRVRAYLERHRERRIEVEGVQPARLRASFMNDTLVVIFLVSVLFWNLTTVSSVAMPTGVRPASLLLGLNQKWSMFAPRPTVNDGWYIVPGTLKNGSQVDLMSVVRGDYDPSEEVSWEKPEVVAYTDHTEHWRKYLEAIRQTKFADQRPYFTSYLCRAWNEQHTGGQQLERLRIFYMQEPTPPDYGRPEVEKVFLWQQSCSPDSEQTVVGAQVSAKTKPDG